MGGLLSDSNFRITEQCSTETNNEEAEGPSQGSGRCCCCSDFQMLVENCCKEAVASMGDICSIVKDMGNELQSCCGGGGCSDIRGSVLRFLTRMQTDAIYGITASKLNVQVDDVQYFVAKARGQEQHDIGGSKYSLVLDSFEQQVAHHVKAECTKFSKCYRLPMLFFWMFATRCTLIAVLRSSIFIPTTMAAMLFACDMHMAAMLGAFFFQASGGALAENADPKCTPQGIGEQIGRLIAIGLTTAVVGMVPSMVLARLHQRDFITVDSDEHPAWKHQLRLWQIQDRVIYTVGTLIIAFCTFFNIVFIANVTTEDGMAWIICVITSMAQSIFAVPFVMAAMIFTVAIIGQLFARVREDTGINCLCDSISNGTDGIVAGSRAQPLSKWNSAQTRILQRKNSGRDNGQDEHPAALESSRAMSDDASLRLEIDEPQPRCLPCCTQTVQWPSD